MRAAQDGGDLLVPGHHPAPGVGDEQDEIGLGDRGASLLGHGARQRRRVGDVDPARVDQEKPLPVPLADELLAVACHSGCLVHDRGPALGQPVDQGRLADVRKADDRDRAEERRHSGLSSLRLLLLHRQAA